MSNLFKVIKPTKYSERFPEKYESEINNFAPKKKSELPEIENQQSKDILQYSKIKEMKQNLDLKMDKAKYAFEEESDTEKFIYEKYDEYHNASKSSESNLISKDFHKQPANQTKENSQNKYEPIEQENSFPVSICNNNYDTLNNNSHKNNEFYWWNDNSINSTYKQGFRKNINMIEDEEINFQNALQDEMPKEVTFSDINFSPLLIKEEQFDLITMPTNTEKNFNNPIGKVISIIKDVNNTEDQQVASKINCNSSYNTDYDKNKNKNNLTVNENYEILFNSLFEKEIIFIYLRISNSH
jgi:hypothetical protein